MDPPLVMEMARQLAPGDLSDEELRRTVAQNWPNGLGLEDIETVIEGLADASHSRTVVTTAVRLCEAAVANSEALNRSKGALFMRMAQALLTRADAGEYGMASIARTLSEEARSYFPQGQKDYGLALLTEAVAVRRMAEAGEGIAAPMMEDAVASCREARACFRADNHGERVQALFTEAALNIKLAQLGGEYHGHLQQALSLYAELRSFVPERTPDFGKALASEVSVRTYLAEVTDDSEEHLAEVLPLCQRLRSEEYFPAGSEPYGGVLLNEANVRTALANLGVDVLRNLDEACALYQDAQPCFKDRPQYYGSVLLGEANARAKAAEHGYDVMDNCERAIVLCQEARRGWAKGEVAGAAYLNEANAHFTLADKGKDRRINLEQAISLFERVRDVLPDTNLYHNLALANEACALVMLAELGVDDERNVATAFAKARAARARLPKNSLSYVVSLYSEAGAYKFRAGKRRSQGRDPSRPAQLARQRYEDAGRSATDNGYWHHALKAFHECGQMLYDLDRKLQAYESYVHASEAVERMRGLIQLEENRREFLERNALLLRDLVLVCTELHEEAEPTTALGRTATWAEEAWHWAEHAKLRTLRDLLGNAKPHLDTEPKRQASAAWDTAQRNLYMIDQRHRARERPDRLRLDAAVESTDADRLATDLALARQEELARRKEFLAVLRLGRDLVQVEVPPPATVALALRELVAPTQRGADTLRERRPALVEYFFTGEDTYCLFFLPLWTDGDGRDALPLTLRHVRLATGAVNRVRTSFDGAVAEAYGRYAQPNSPRTRRHVTGGADAPAPEVPGNGAAFFSELPQMLGNLFVEPWRDLLDEWQPSELIVVANGPLHLLPLHAADIEGQWLIERYPLVYLPAATLSDDLVNMRTHREARTASGPALVFGPPGGDLPMADQEAHEVADHFRTRPYQHERMRIGTLKEQARQASWVHLATHSEFSHKEFDNSQIFFHGEALRPPHLFAGDALDFPNLEMWYQGSCESAGHEQGGTDELVGFVRALFYAGARSVMATLWAVEDEAAYRFAHRFYFYLRKRNPKIVAYQKAVGDLRVRYGYTDPFLCAPFVLFGDACV